ncbi:MAG: acetyl-CoA acetyltransferase [Elusimicrobia bacterium RIFCSPLOWO2_12_FULL_59_9]|nr:MAG: acetyl-CoA acetyltransferase [Elusimicrobia bacterium RIFCSPLOWO2_12_FULL_59_9]
MEQTVILSGRRTPIGTLNGALASYTAPQLGAKAIIGALEAARLAPKDVDEVILGNVLSAGIGQAPARQASIGAGIPVQTGATTVNKVCGSGLKAVMLGAQSIQLGDSSIVVAGGMESMSKAPYLLEKARSGYRFGHSQLIDSVIKDGLWDPYKDMSMGICGELCAEKHAISREEQDAFAILSYQRAQESQRKGLFAEEIAVVDGIAEDEEPQRVKFEKIPKLKPAFKPGGSVTAANSSKIDDGAAALVLASASRAQALGLAPMAAIRGWATHSQEPEWFTTAPAGAIEKLLSKLGWKVAEVDLFEINEAFSVVALAVMKLAGIPADKVNVRGGAVALGHPIGASGARILVTLLHALKQENLRRGVAAICLGGGEAVAVAVERTS